MLNYTPQVYEAIIAAFIVVGLIQSFVLSRKWRQAEALKSNLKTVAVEATKALVTSAMIGSLKVAAAKAQTRRIADAADEALEAAQSLIETLTERVEELESQESRIDSIEDTVDELVAAHNETVAPTIKSFGLPARFPFESPGPFAGAGGDLFASLARNGFTPTGRRADRGPSIKAFKITPDGLVPVNGPEDFGLSGLSTSTRPDPSHRAPSVADILSALASFPSPRRTTSAFPPDFGVPEALLKADLSGKPGEFLYDEHGPAAPGDAYADAADAARASVAGTAETEACNTQRAPEPQTASPEPQAAAPVAGGAESPAAANTNDPGRRVPRYAGRRPLPEGFPGFGIQSPRAG